MAVLPFAIEGLLGALSLGEATQTYNNIQSLYDNSSVPNINVDKVIDFYDTLNRPLINTRTYHDSLSNEDIQVSMLGDVTESSGSYTFHKDNIFTLLPLEDLVRAVFVATGISLKKVSENNIINTITKVINGIKADYTWTPSEIRELKYVAPLSKDELNNIYRSWANKDLVDEIIKSGIREGIYTLEDKLEPKEVYSVNETVTVPSTTEINSLDDVQITITNSLGIALNNFKEHYDRPFTIPALSPATILNDLLALAPSIRNYYSMFTFAYDYDFKQDQSDFLKLIIKVYFFASASTTGTFKISQIRDINDGWSTSGVSCGCAQIAYSVNLRLSSPYWYKVSSDTKLLGNQIINQAGIYATLIKKTASELHTNATITFNNLLKTIKGGYEGVEAQSGVTLPRVGITDFPAWLNSQQLITTIPADGIVTGALIRAPYIPITVDGTSVGFPVTGTLTDAQTGILDIPAVNVKDKVLAGSEAGEKTRAEADNPSIAVPDYPNPTLPNNPTPLLPSLPTLGGAGMGTIYNPNASQMSAIKSALWNESALDIVKRFFTNNPLDTILSSSITFANPNVAGTKEVQFGYYLTGVTGVNYITNQYTAINCGTVTINEVFGNYMDYEPYTSVGVYLPFIGIRELRANDVIGKQVKIVYRCDVVTGACIAIISVIKNSIEQILYTFEGNCNIDLPLSASSVNLKGMLAGVGTMTAGVLTANPLVVAGGALNSFSSIAPSVGTVGSLGGNTGALAGKKPYIIIKRLKPNNAFNYPAIIGYPANKTITLGACHGFTKVKEIHLDGIACTDIERQMIYDLLTSGVIL